VFVDQQFLQFINGQRADRSRGSHNMPRLRGRTASSHSASKFCGRRQRPTLGLGPASPEWITLTNKVWQRAEVTQAALDQTSR